MANHKEHRWYWGLASGDLLTGLGQAIRVYQQRFHQEPEVVWLNASLIERLQQPIGIEVQADGHLSKAMAAFGLPDGWQPARLELPLREA
jgi:hypothetical protein